MPFISNEDQQLAADTLAASGSAPVVTNDGDGREVERYVQPASPGNVQYVQETVWQNAAASSRAGAHHVVYFTRTV